MLSTPDGPFINLARLNFSKYAARPNLAKALFEYIFHHENDIRNVSALLCPVLQSILSSYWVVLFSFLVLLILQQLHLVPSMKNHDFWGFVSLVGKSISVLP